jgi:iron(III) transport system ATP-binding protein
MLQLKNIEITYPQLLKPTLSNLSINVGNNEIVALVGPSGSGKSTLLKIAAGLLSVDKGDVRLDNKHVDGPTEKLVAGHPKIKMIHQDFNLFPKISVIDNIEFHLRHLVDKAKLKRINEMLKLCKLEKLKDKKPYELSGGEKQRLAIAKTLADEPLLLLMDEPFTALDNILKNDIMDDIFEIVDKAKISTLFVTHDTRDAISYAHRILVMKNGKIVSNASPEKSYQQPKNKFVAEFFGNANIIKADQAHLLNIKNELANEIIIRYENIHEIENGFEATVIESKYLGFGYESKLLIADLISLKMWSSEKLDKTVRISIDRYWEL